MLIKYKFGIGDATFRNLVLVDLHIQYVSCLNMCLFVMGCCCCQNRKCVFLEGKLIHLKETHFFEIESCDFMLIGVKHDDFKIPACLKNPDFVKK